MSLVRRVTVNLVSRAIKTYILLTNNATSLSDFELPGTLLLASIGTDTGVRGGVRGISNGFSKPIEASLSFPAVETASIPHSCLSCSDGPTGYSCGKSTPRGQVRTLSMFFVWSIAAVEGDGHMVSVVLRKDIVNLYHTKRENWKTHLDSKYLCHFQMIGSNQGKPNNVAYVARFLRKVGLNNEVFARESHRSRVIARNDGPLELRLNRIPSAPAVPNSAVKDSDELSNCWEKRCFKITCRPIPFPSLAWFAHQAK